MFTEYLKLTAVALFPVLATILFILCDKYLIPHLLKSGKFKLLNSIHEKKILAYCIKQIIYGGVFGGLAILGNVWSIQIHDVLVNCRDAAVLTGGLLFGSPAGIIAGSMGALHRWLAASGDFTRLACSLSTFIAGVLAALLRQFLFKNKRPGVIPAFLLGVVIEVFHLLMVFVTNGSSPEHAYQVVASCTAPMLIANGLSVMFSAIAYKAIDEPKKFFVKPKLDTLAKRVQLALAIVVSLSFVLSTVFMVTFQNQMANSSNEALLTEAITDTGEDVNDKSNEFLLKQARLVRADLIDDPDRALDDILNVTEIQASSISIVDVTEVDGHFLVRVRDSSEHKKGFIGFDFSRSPQSREFIDWATDPNVLSQYDPLNPDSKDYFVQDLRPSAQDPTALMKYAGILYMSNRIVNKLQWNPSTNMYDPIPGEYETIKARFIQVGFDLDLCQAVIAGQVKNLTENRHISKSGSITIVDDDYKIVSKRKDIPESYLMNAIISTKDRTDIEDGKIFVMNLEDDSYVCMVKWVEGYGVIASLPFSEAFLQRNIALFTNTFLEVIVFGLLFVFIYLVIEKLIVRKIKVIDYSLKEITEGNLEVVVPGDNTKEFSTLADGINGTVGALKGYIKEAETRIDKELAFAKSIQASALPSVFPPFPKNKEFDFFASMYTAKEVGGDFYDFYLVDSTRVGFLVADVSGKGIPGAMFMMESKTMIKNYAAMGYKADHVLTRANTDICHDNGAGMFVTCWYGTLDFTNGSVMYANAGHNPPVVYRAKTNKWEYARSKPGLVLGAFDTFKYERNMLELEKGDRIFLYTDGVTESTREDGGLYGEERLLKVLNKNVNANINKITDLVKEDIDKFVGTAPQFDDITMLVLEYKGKQE